ncbi:protein of unknown function [Legionella micdadei]|uniref:Uncharacterized protein n=1 Tax=Legionella micdadei TaxID=451 RepID=A0A098GGR9_LEGMI|nr:hypothetical protein Lmic_2743 [Legionella micdadei]CEG61654.1 protein of unknown function [Legionella micdadei]SCY48267.1 hypothetical protein SAMN02982997_01863 [Legionella micdadei]
MSSSDKSNPNKITAKHRNPSRAVRIEICYRVAEREPFFDEKTLNEEDQIRIQLPEPE